MTWRFTESYVIPQRMTDISTTAQVPVGTVARAHNDSDNTSGEFIYLEGVASTVAGSWVTYDTNGASVLLVASAVGPVAIAMAANVASSYGWYMISGNTVAQAWTTLALASTAILYATASAGIVDDAVVSGDRIFNAVPEDAKTTAVGTFTVQINRPWITNEDPTA